MSRLIKIANWSGPPRASVIFVHGLGGHAYDTWRRAPNDDTFWPLRLAQDVVGISVYTVSYEAPVTNWLGTSMPLQDRAVNILEYLLSEQGPKSGPVVFVCHSLGGLIVKQIVLDLQQQRERRPEAADFLQRVTQVVFAATPHTGARQGTWLDRLRFLAWPSTIARTLVANDPTLRSVNVAYRGLADERRNVLQHRVFYETQDTPAGVIVDEASADPGLPGDPPIPIDADHISIVKPSDRSALLYVRVRDFVAKNPALAEQKGALEFLPLPAVRSEQSLNPIPKLVRIATIGLVGLIGYRGMQSLIAPPPTIEQIQKPFVAQLATKDAQIAALTKMLLEKNPSGEGGAAQQAVGGAVHSIAQGANEGDKRLQQALDLLNENKVAEATGLLNAVAEDKTAQAERAAAQAEKDRKVAATAYRNLGAIAGLRDPKKALEAYSKAIEFDPEDRDALYWHGYFSLAAGHLTAADQSLTRLLQRSSEAGDPHGIYRANLRLGELAKQRGYLDLDLQYQEKAKAIATKQIAADPGNVEWQHDLSVSYFKIGDVRKARGDLADALKSYEDALVIRGRLAKSDLNNVLWQHYLTIAYNEIGSVKQMQGDLAGALASYKDSLDISVRLAKSDPSNWGWQSNLAMAYGAIGGVKQAQGDLAGALASY